MNDLIKDLIERMKSEPAFPILLERIVAQAPTIPAYDRNSNNVEEWKHCSSMRQGYEAALLQFNIKLENKR